MGILTFVVILVLLSCFIRTGFHFSLDYNEGWNASYAQKVLNKEMLYAGSSPYIYNNYPPFSFYIIAFLSKASGDVLITGRYLSLFSVLLISFIVALIIKEKGGDLYETVFSGVFCIGLFSILANHYVGMNDPQLFGNLLGTIALFVYIKSNKKLMFLIAFLLTLSVFIKHSLIILPISLLLDLFLDNYKKALRFILFMCINISVFIALLFIMSEQQFLFQIFNYESSRNFSVFQLIYNSSFELAWIQIPLVVGLISLFLFLKGGIARTILIYTLVSLIVGVYFTGGSGVDVNVFFDLFISLSVAVGFTLTYARNFLNKGGSTKSIYWLLPFIVSFGLILQSPGKIIRPGLYKRYVEKEKEFFNDTDILKEHAGMMITEDILLSYYSGKEFVFDAFNVSQLLQSGKLDENKLIGDIEKGKYSIIQMDAKINPDFNSDSIYDRKNFSGRFSNNTLKSIEKHYSLFHVSSNGAYYQYGKINR
jgi:hypothetical protein